MSEFIISDEDSLEVVLNNPTIVGNVDTALLVASIDGVVSLVFEMAVDPASGGLTEQDVLNLIRSEDVFANYKTQELDDADPILYVGQIKTTGEWFLTRSIDTLGDLQILYANVSNNVTMTTFNLAWTNRATLNYTLINGLTGV